jgi:hypothetical protein
MPLLSDAWNNMFGTGYSNYPWLTGTDQKINPGSDPATQSIAAGGPPLAPGMTQDQLASLSDLNKPSLFQSMMDKVGSSGSLKDLQSAAAGMANTTQQPKFSQIAPPQMPYHPMSPNNIYTSRQYSPLDPDAALKALLMGR